MSSKKVKGTKQTFVKEEIKKTKSIWVKPVECLNGRQREFQDSIRTKEVTIVTGLAGSGKTFIALYNALKLLEQGYKRIVLVKSVTTLEEENIGFLPGPQPLYSKILTPDGWTTMGELKVGDFIISRDGNPTKVLEIFDKGEKDVYRIYTTDDSYTDCCIDHLWLTQTFENKKRNKPGSVKTTKDLLMSLYTKDGKPNHYLPRNEAVNYTNSIVPIPPYMLGCLLGDGSIGKNISIAGTDEELINRFNEELKELGCYLNKVNGTISYSINSSSETKKRSKKVKITNMFDMTFVIYNTIGDALKNIDVNRGTLNSRCVRGSIINGFKYEFLEPDVLYSTNKLKENLYKLHLIGTKCFNKFIPDIYKYSNVDIRLELLRGLMDTDGSISKKGDASFCTTSKQLALDVQEIVRSLGGRCLIKSRNRIGKESILNDRIITTRLESYEFTVSMPENLNPFYITRKANRHKCAYMHRVAISNIEKLENKEKVQCIKVSNPEHLYITDNFIVTHNTIEDKMQPFMMSYTGNLNKLVGEKEAAQMFKDKIVEILPLAYIRGINIDDSVVLLDETQNLNLNTFKSIITRIGTNSKYIIMGDTEQIDMKERNKSALIQVMELFKDSDIVGTVEFTDEDCVRNPIIPYLLNKIKEIE